jgi:hypothetical protein
LQGIGFNVTNAALTTPINYILKAMNRCWNANGEEGLKPYTQESQFAGILIASGNCMPGFAGNEWDKYLRGLVL